MERDTMEATAKEKQLGDILARHSNGSLLRPMIRLKTSNQATQSLILLCKSAVQCSENRWVQCVMFQPSAGLEG